MPNLMQNDRPWSKLTNLSPGSWTTAASNLMNEWEKSLRAPETGVDCQEATIIKDHKPGQEGLYENP